MLFHSLLCSIAPLDVLFPNNENVVLGNRLQILSRWMTDNEDLSEIKELALNPVAIFIFIGRGHFP